ncbi:hypothetical protein NE237_011111 [Protea cynaroides]|uniref:Magnesium transporter n=1 Tax=Protea cynaroides TaxID=273540 RepID=A0A9Q0GV21_9MAGN|nr:hypothetical protein NE237_011111 [Protea cynaroides]
MHLSCFVSSPQADLTKKIIMSKSWIALDSTGKGTILNIDKYAIIQRVEIHTRDLRILDPVLSYPSTILGREKAIVLNLEVLLPDPQDDNIIPIVEELKKRLPISNLVGQGQGDGKEQLNWQNDEASEEDDESPFEFRALEVALEAICSFLDERTTDLENDAYPALDELTTKVSSRIVDRVRKLKSALTKLTARVQKVRDELEQLLNDDNDMAELYLSRKLVGIPVPLTIESKITRANRTSVATFRRDDQNNIEELEMLLEAYFIEIDGTLNKLISIIHDLDVQIQQNPRRLFAKRGNMNSNLVLSCVWMTCILLVRS